MKRLLCLLIACLLILPACAADPEPELGEMLGTLENDVYTSAFGFAIDLEGMRINTAQELAVMNQLEDGVFTEEALMKKTKDGIAVGILSASPSESDSILTLSLALCSELPDTIQSAEDYAEYGASTIPGKLERAGYTDVQVRRISVTLDDGEHPAILCSAKLTDDIPYHLLQVCFREGDWMGGLSLSSLSSEEALRQLLTHVTSTN